MDDTRIDRLESRFDELAAEMRSGFRGVDTRLCKIESRLDQTASTVNDIEVRLGKVEVRLDFTATNSDLDNLRTEMYRNNAAMKTWLAATMITIIALFCVALFGLHHWNG